MNKTIYIVKTAIISILAFGALISCSNNVKTKQLKKHTRDEVLEIVLEDLVKLNNTKHILQESNDTLFFSNLTLIYNSSTDIEINTAENLLFTFTMNSIYLDNPFFEESMESIESQIENLSSTNWDTSSLNIDIPVDNPLEELDDAPGDITSFWIDSNIKEKSFIKVSEPIFNVNGDVIVSANISTGKYIIGKLYILENSESGLKVGKTVTMVGKLTFGEKIENPEPNKEETYSQTQYLMFLGYYDFKG